MTAAFDHHLLPYSPTLLTVPKLGRPSRLAFLTFGFLSFAFLGNPLAFAFLGNPLGGGGWIRTTEAFASDLQSDPFDRSGTPPILRR